jgi:hypothetical protein
MPHCPRKQVGHLVHLTAAFRSGNVTGTTTSSRGLQIARSRANMIYETTYLRSFKHRHFARQFNVHVGDFNVYGSYY